MYICMSLKYKCNLIFWQYTEMVIKLCVQCSVVVPSMFWFTNIHFQTMYTTVAESFNIWAQRKERLENKLWTCKLLYPVILSFAFQTVTNGAFSLNFISFL